MFKIGDLGKWHKTGLSLTWPSVKSELWADDRSNCITDTETHKSTVQRQRRTRPWQHRDIELSHLGKLTWSTQPTHPSIGRQNERLQKPRGDKTYRVINYPHYLKVKAGILLWTVQKWHWSFLYSQKHQDLKSPWTDNSKSCKVWEIYITLKRSVAMYQEKQFSKFSKMKKVIR